MGACTVQAVTGLSSDHAGSDSSPVPAPSSSVTLVQDTAAAPHSSVADLVKEDLASVVNVRVRSVSFNEFGGAQESNAEGSGVIIAPSGVILTNNHVIANSVKVQVVFNDNHDPVAGTVVGADLDHDLAVVRVPYHDLTPMKIGSSDQLELGDAVVAIGFPLGLGGPTVTSGIVSGQNRTVDVSKETGGTEHLVGLIQTDAAINPGNSGGALINSAGELIGINTAGANAGKAENVGFAIAIDRALPVVQQILAKRPSERAWLGVQVESIDSAAAAEQVGYPPDARGAAIVTVLSVGPAQKAGLKAGYLIEQIDSQDINSADDLTNTLSRYSPGDTVDVKVLTSQGLKTFTVTLGNLPRTFEG
jgi:S1-C subfamily serine protease